MSQRISTSELEARRRDRTSRILVTGGTGFLGSHIASELLRRGYPISLLARSGERPAAERVSRLLDWFGLSPEERRRLAVVEGDISQPKLGIASAALDDLLQTTGEVIHCASNTSFSARKRAGVEAVNIGGLSQVLEFAAASRTYFFHHVSTAYVAGQVSGPCAEVPVNGHEFHNAYEETKARGEQMAATACAEAGIRLIVYRPTIVYGDSRTGRSLRFNAVYHPVRMALFIRDLCERDVRQGNGRQAAALGVSAGPFGTTHLPMRMEAAENGGVNIIPVDYLTSAFLALMEGEPDGGIFHIANDRLTRIEDFVGYASRLFRLTGIRTCPAGEFETTPRNPLETLYEHYVGAYAPYMKDTRVFATDNSRPILALNGIACPAFDYEVFRRCMLFAVETDWGARLFLDRVVPAAAATQRPP